MPKITDDTDPSVLPQTKPGVPAGTWDGPVPTDEYLQDCARGTLQEWFDGYMPHDGPMQEYQGNPLGQWYADRVGEFGDADLYRISPVTEMGVARGKGPVYRIQILVERDLEAEL
jgi:hypothetical protein